MLEKLESRVLFAFTVGGPIDGKYTLTGTEAADSVSLTCYSGDRVLLIAGDNNVYHDAWQVEINCLGDNDTVIVTKGDTPPAGTNYISVVVNGGAGVDDLSSDMPGSGLNGDDGNDVLYGRGPGMIITGGKNRDDINFTRDGYNSAAYGGDGNDYLSAFLINLVPDPQRPDHNQGVSLYGDGGADKLVGSDGDDYLEGGYNSGDELYGMGGDDSLWAVDSFEDTVCDGGAGHDIYYGDWDPLNPNSPDGRDHPVNCETKLLW